MKAQYLYLGNGLNKDRLDAFVASYMRAKKLYVEVTYVQHSIYIIGGGFSVKVQQARDKLLVTDGPISNSFIPVETHLESNHP
jgi:hypothetical protein